MTYDFLVVGAGLFGATFAERAKAAGKSVLVLEKRDHVAGNAYTREISGIQTHIYGPHIFHTDSDEVWEYVNRFARFHHFINSPIAVYHGEKYSLPFNMYTFRKMWGVTAPDEAKKILDGQIKAAGIRNPRNLEEQALSMVGRDLYETLIKEYTEKQWGKPCSELPAFIIRRLPVRFTYDNRYFDDLYQGVPIDGYTKMAERLLDGIEIEFNTDYLSNKDKWNSLAENVIYTGSLDEYYDYCYGVLEYRSVYFETELLDLPDYQGNAVVNYTDRETPYTRIIEHKHFAGGGEGKTVISREYSKAWKRGDERFYPINSETNNALYARYKALADQEKGFFAAGRLGEYSYYNMDQVIQRALDLSKVLLQE